MSGRLLITSALMVVCRAGVRRLRAGARAARRGGRSRKPAPARMPRCRRPRKKQLLPGHPAGRRPAPGCPPPPPLHRPGPGPPSPSPFLSPRHPGGLSGVVRGWCSPPLFVLGEQRAEGDAADDHPADLRAALGAGAGRDRQRHRAQHHRAGGHQDRAQAQRRRPRSPPRACSALLLQLVGELDDQDAVLGDQPDQRDRPIWL